MLTFVSYEKTEDGVNYSVPGGRPASTRASSSSGIGMLSYALRASSSRLSESDLASSVNALIQERLDRHLEQARQDWEDYRTAFFATGGTQEQWGDREMDVSQSAPEWPRCRSPPSSPPAGPGG